MLRIASALALVTIGTFTAHAQGVYDVCKGESKTAVAGTGKPTIAMVYLDDFPVVTTPQMRNSLAATIARNEKAKIVPAKDVDMAKKLVDGKKWDERSEACGQAPSLVAALGLKHPNLSTGTVTVTCEGDKCVVNVDLERHGAKSKDRWVRYQAPLVGPKDKIKTIHDAGPKLRAMGAPPDAPKAGLEIAELKPGVVTVRSDVDGSLETDRIMEGNPAFAACAPKGRKDHDVRGYWAEWSLSAKGNPFQVQVKAFGGREKSDETASECLRKAFEKMQLRCPRDGRAVPKIKTAICL